MTRRLLALAAACAGLLAATGAAARDKHTGIVVQDLAYGEVLFDFFQEDYFAALTRLLAARAARGDPHHAAESELMLGGLYLSYGEHRLAGEIFDRVLAQSVDPALNDRAWFFLAKIWYQRGYLEESAAALGRINDALPERAGARAADVACARCSWHRAVSMTRSLLSRAGGVRADEWVGYAKYNIGVTLVRLGRIEEGARVLDEVGQLEPKNAELAALRDKANLALGYAWLQAAHPVEAKPSLERVRLTGPFSNKALLGVGWSDAETKDYRGALAPWLELRNRNLLDSAVQESLLAVPYAFAQLGADKQAADHYVDAIEAFTA